MSKYRKGIVRSFDLSANQGFILDEESGRSYYVHASAIEPEEDIGKFEKNKEVEFSLYENLYMKQVDVVQLVETRKKKRERLKVVRT